MELDLSEAMLAAQTAWGTEDDHHEAVTAAVLAAAPIIERQVREKLAAELAEWADTHPPMSAIRRHGHIAARRVGPKLTLQDVADALMRGNYVYCHLDDAGRAIPPGERPHNPEEGDN